MAYPVFVFVILIAPLEAVLVDIQHEAAHTGHIVAAEEPGTADSPDSLQENLAGSMAAGSPAGMTDMVAGIDLVDTVGMVAESVVDTTGFAYLNLMLLQRTLLYQSNSTQ